MLNKDQFADNHFIRTIIEEDLKSGKHTAIQTRFPPEPNGYLHIGHAKSICLNFGLAYIYDGLCNLRFDDTNPEKENDEYVNAIKEDVEWLGFHWAGEPRFASNYFDQLYDYAVDLIKDGKAYVDDLTPEQMREYRGTLTEAGKNSPYRDRTEEENLDLFTRMKNGEFPDGSKTLRLKIDMASGNINMRDPVIYRIRRAHHHNTGDKWCIYPMYDYTHCISDAIEGITHSLCTLEFEAHRPLYDWVLNNISKNANLLNRIDIIINDLYKIKKLTNQDNEMSYSYNAHPFVEPSEQEFDKSNKRVDEIWELEKGVIESIKDLSRENLLHSWKEALEAITAPYQLSVHHVDSSIQILKAPIRVFPFGAFVFHHLQTQAEPTGFRRPRYRLGRPAYADHFRYAPPRLHARRPAPVCQTRRYFQI